MSTFFVKKTDTRGRGRIFFVEKNTSEGVEVLFFVEKSPPEGVDNVFFAKKRESLSARRPPPSGGRGALQDG